MGQNDLTVNDLERVLLMAHDRTEGFYQETDVFMPSLMIQERCLKLKPSAKHVSRASYTNI